MAFGALKGSVRSVNPKIKKENQITNKQFVRQTNTYQEMGQESLDLMEFKFISDLEQLSIRKSYRTKVV